MEWVDEHLRFKDRIEEHLRAIVEALRAGMEEFHVDCLCCEESEVLGTYVEGYEKMLPYTEELGEFEFTCWRDIDFEAKDNPTKYRFRRLHNGKPLPRTFSVEERAKFEAIWIAHLSAIDQDPSLPHEIGKFSSDEIASAFADYLEQQQIRPVVCLRGSCRDERDLYDVWYAPGWVESEAAYEQQWKWQWDAMDHGAPWEMCYYSREGAEALRAYLLRQQLLPVESAEIKEEEYGDGVYVVEYVLAPQPNDEEDEDNVVILA